MRLKYKNMVRSNYCMFICVGLKDVCCLRYLLTSGARYNIRCFAARVRRALVSWSEPLGRYHSGIPFNGLFTPRKGKYDKTWNIFILFSE